MKVIVSFLIVGLLIVGGVYAYSAFCQGYQDGYRAGYCYGKIACVAPFSMCPMAWMGQDTYNDGYNQGFNDGMRDR